VSRLKPLSETNDSPVSVDGKEYRAFQCPSCGFPVCEWTDCPECGWYNEEIWEVSEQCYGFGSQNVLPDGGVPIVDEVVVNASGASGASRSFHLPDEGDEPLCSMADREDREWLRKDAALYPSGYFSWCQLCLDKAAADGGGSA